MLDKYVSQFEAQQQEVLNIMVDLGRQDEFEDTDVLTTDEMEKLCGHIRMVAEIIQDTSTERKQISSPDRFTWCPQ